MLKITDSNGNILYNKTMYRQLEYIYFSGTEGIDTLETPQQHFYFLDASVEGVANNHWGCLWGAGDNSSGSNFRLWYQLDVGTTPNRIAYRCKADNTQMIADAPSYYGTKLEFRCRVYATNNTNGRYWWAINDVSDEDLTTNPQNENPGTQIEGIYINNSSYAFNFNNYPTTLGIGQQRYNQGWGSNSQSVMKVYRYYTRLTDDSSNIDKLMYPVQRKSDGLCGLYDVLNNIFYPMQGTNITTTAAGPTLNENPSWSPDLEQSYTLASIDNNDSGINIPLNGNGKIRSIKYSMTMSHGAINIGTNKEGLIYIRDGDGNYVRQSSSTSSDTMTVTDLEVDYTNLGTSATYLVRTGTTCTYNDVNCMSIIGLYYEAANNRLRLQPMYNNSNMPTASITDLTMTIYYEDPDLL